MKIRLIHLSLAANALLVTCLGWMYVEHRAEHRDLCAQFANADEIYIELLAASLDALEAVESDEAEYVKTRVRPLVATGLENVELRKGLGF